MKKYNDRQFLRLDFILEPFDIDLDYEIKEDKIDIRNNEHATRQPNVNLGGIAPNRNY